MICYPVIKFVRPWSRFHAGLWPQTHLEVGVPGFLLLVWWR